MLYVSGVPSVTVHEMVDGSPADAVEGVAKADETVGRGLRLRSIARRKQEREQVTELSPSRRIDNDLSRSLRIDASQARP